MSNNSFLTLAEAIYNPPLSMIVAFLIVLGMWHFADVISKNKLVKAGGDLQRILLVYIVVIASVSVLVHTIYFLRINGFYLLKIIGTIFIIMGAYYLIKIIVRKEFKFVKKISEREDNKKLQMLSIVLIAIPLFLIALGPPTDPDSLDYHLGVPLDWLRNNQAYPRYDWISARLVGLGESINLFGLINGTDILGQIVQYSGLIVAWTGISNFANTLRLKYLSALLVLTSPVMLYLATVQKPQLFPSAALVFGVLLLLKNRENYDRKIFLFSMVSILFAISNKYSFLIAGMVAIIVSIVIAKKNKDIKFALLVIFLLFMLINFPLYLRNYLFYGDPLSPLFENFKSSPDIDVLDYARHIREYEGGLTIKKVLMLPITLTFTTKLNFFSTVLGIGTLGLLVVYNVSGVSRVILSLSILIALGFLLIGQTLPRYYLESYFLLAASIVSTQWGCKHTYLKRGLLLQSIPVAISAVYGAIILFPGAITNDLRNYVMNNHAFCYQEAQWIDKYLPKDSVIIADVRSYALIPRKFVVPDKIKGNPENLMDIIEKNNVTSMLIPYPNDDPVWKGLENYADKKISEKKIFTRATRNPLNAGAKYQMWLFTLNTDLNKRIGLCP